MSNTLLFMSNTLLYVSNTHSCISPVDIPPFRPFVPAALSKMPPLSLCLPLQWKALFLSSSCISSPEQGTYGNSPVGAQQLLGLGPWSWAHIDYG